MENKVSLGTSTISTSSKVYSAPKKRTTTTRSDHGDDRTRKYVIIVMIMMMIRGPRRICEKIIGETGKTRALHHQKP